jgi:hypothetical protein
VSSQGSDLLEVQNASVGHRVDVRVTPGACGPGSPHAIDA